MEEVEVVEEAGGVGEGGPEPGLRALHPARQQLPTQPQSTLHARLQRSRPLLQIGTLRGRPQVSDLNVSHGQGALRKGTEGHFESGKRWVQSEEGGGKAGV